MNKENNLKLIHNQILKIASTERAINCKWFFKTGPGEYGEGDKFLGITVPATRNLAKAFKHIDLKEVQNLLHSKFHEERLLALLILVIKYEESKKLNKKFGKEIRQNIFDLYFKNIKYINNWDLVDLSASKIVGEFIKEKYSLKTKNCSGIKFLISLVSDKNIFSNPRSKSDLEKLWEKRIGILASYSFINDLTSTLSEGEIKNTFNKSEIIFEIVKQILNEKSKLNNHDLIQKACGWMLREYGKRIDGNKLKKFLEQNFKKIKERRTLLHYAIERFSKEERKYWLNKQ